MRASLPIFAALAVAFSSARPASGQDTNRYTKVATQLMEWINAGNYAAIQAKFNTDMGAALPLDKSTAFLSRLTQQVGKIQKLGEPHPAGEWMIFPTKFEKGTFDMQLALDDTGLIAGLAFRPQAATKSKPALPGDRYTKVANQLKELINAADYRGIQAKFNAEMGAALPLDKSSEFFKSLSQQVGKIQKFGNPQTIGEVRVFRTECENGTLDMQLALDDHGLIAGLTFTPHAEQ